MDMPQIVSEAACQYLRQNTWLEQGADKSGLKWSTVYLEQPCFPGINLLFNALIFTKQLLSFCP